MESDNPKLERPFKSLLSGRWPEYCQEERAYSRNRRIENH